MHVCHPFLKGALDFFHCLDMKQISKCLYEFVYLIIYICSFHIKESYNYVIHLISPNMMHMKPTSSLLANLKHYKNTNKIGNQKIRIILWIIRLKREYLLQILVKFSSDSVSGHNFIKIYRRYRKWLSCYSWIPNTK